MVRIPAPRWNGVDPAERERLERTVPYSENAMVLLAAPIVDAGTIQLRISQKRVTNVLTAVFDFNKQ
jgi:hypothetical protein